MQLIQVLINILTSSFTTFTISKIGVTRTSVFKYYHEKACSYNFSSFIIYYSENIIKIVIIFIKMINSWIEWHSIINHLSPMQSFHQSPDNIFTYITSILHIQRKLISYLYVNSSSMAILNQKLNYISQNRFIKIILLIGTSQCSNL